MSLKQDKYQLGRVHWRMRSIYCMKVTRQLPFLSIRCIGCTKWQVYSRCALMSSILCGFAFSSHLITSSSVSRVKTLLTSMLQFSESTLFSSSSYLESYWLSQQMIFNLNRGTDFPKSFQRIFRLLGKMVMLLQLEQLSRWLRLLLFLDSRRESLELRAMKSLMNSEVVQVASLRQILNRFLKHSLILLMIKLAKSSLSKRMDVIMVQMFSELKSQSSRERFSPVRWKSYIISTVMIRILRISSMSYIISSKVAVFFRNSRLRYFWIIWLWRFRFNLLRNLYRSGRKSCLTFLQNLTQFQSLQTSSSLKFLNSAYKCAITELFSMAKELSKEVSPLISSCRMNMSQLFRLSRQSEKSRKRQLSRISLRRQRYLFSGAIAKIGVGSWHELSCKSGSSLMVQLRLFDSQWLKEAIECLRTSYFSSSSASSQYLSMVLRLMSLNSLSLRDLPSLAMKFILLLEGAQGRLRQYSWQQQEFPIYQVILI